MMIKYAEGNLLKSEAEAFVNAVNCVGVMGKGIALQFKNMFPDNFRDYARNCRAGLVEPGRMLVHQTGSNANPKYIINFPTKRHWKARSHVEDIENGLEDLVAVVKKFEIKSIAIPPLGCGNGGLDWRQVEPLILRAFEPLPDVDVWLYAPKSVVL